ncbi:conserved hypothetical protein [Ricinus communis]|uniref:Uncharacterized protein n=1 Tax=Ricinus communis TaxID=3988 RepID=B9S323_RICCO|nr:conserved hypothetical protein [Ricinus communis]
MYGKPFNLKALSGAPFGSWQLKKGSKSKETRQLLLVLSLSLKLIRENYEEQPWHSDCQLIVLQKVGGEEQSSEMSLTHCLKAVQPATNADNSDSIHRKVPVLET